MTRQTLKIFFACAFGAAIGTLVALEVNHYFWWLGLLAGAATGYLSYEFKTVIQNVPKAWALARKDVPITTEQFRTLILFLGAVLMTSSSNFVVFALIGAAYDAPLIVNLQEFAACSLLLSMTTTLFLNAFGYDAVPCISAAKVWGWQIKYLNPCMVFIGWPLCLIYRVTWAVGMVLPRLPKKIYRMTKQVATFLRHFIWRLFLLIHSEIRLLCACDAALGAALGCFTGSVIIGILAGGTIGVLNYQIITERWLKRRGYVTY